MLCNAGGFIGGKVHLLVGGHFAVHALRGDAFGGQQIVGKELRGIRAFTAGRHHAEARVVPADKRLQAAAQTQLHPLLVVAEFGGGHQANKVGFAVRRADGGCRVVIGMGEQHAVARQRLHKSCRGRLLVSLQRLAKLLLIGIANLLVIVGFHLAEPVGVSRFAGGILHRDAAPPFWLGQLPEIGHRAGGVMIGIIGKHVRGQHDGQRVLIAGGNVAFQIVRHPALDIAFFE